MAVMCIFVIKGLFYVSGLFITKIHITAMRLIIFLNISLRYGISNKICEVGLLCASFV